MIPSTIELPQQLVYSLKCWLCDAEFISMLQTFSVIALASTECFLGLLHSPCLIQISNYAGTGMMHCTIHVTKEGWCKCNCHNWTFHCKYCGLMQRHLCRSKNNSVTEMFWKWQFIYSGHKEVSDFGMATIQLSGYYARKKMSKVKVASPVP